ncbi:Demethylmenaquinone methyltransferase [Desulfovibrio desulfuricans]|uniref:Putative 4-hydroxy-4-methyl-2-oxoglutarate aldolase n=1 Tax=Desulfovibrio desulfuricans TaxID=876 RepID=A0AA94HSV3_DESDE|nr:Demethylmenaquinone methyltransferase [Desulfovibrio desulfuricans]SPD35425.1 Ribonuclease E inhibitor RraA/RraA-like protein [Desulfovibrio sp. G11]
MRYAINSSFSRPHPSIIAQYRDLPVADICDALGRNAALPAALRPLGAARMLGTAYTVNLPASQNLLLYYAVDNARPGDVLVVSCAAYEDRAVCGEIMAHLALRSGLAGFVIDGAVRDCPRPERTVLSGLRPRRNSQRAVQRRLRRSKCSCRYGQCGHNPRRHHRG